MKNVYRLVAIISWMIFSVIPLHYVNQSIKWGLIHSGADEFSGEAVGSGIAYGVFFIGGTIIAILPIWMERK